MIVIGADAGGTKTTIAIGNETAELIRVTGPPGAMRPGRGITAASAIADAVRRPLYGLGVTQADALVVGAAGVGRAGERTELREALRAERIAKRIEVVTDAAIGLEALGRAEGIVLIAGTGSIALGRTSTGMVVRQGGYGWQIGDEGGGYSIGRGALRAAGRAHDGRGPTTRLLESIVARIRAADFDGVVRWSTTATTTEVAGLAPLVIEAAGAGDTVAVALLAEAADELAALVRGLLRHFPSEDPIPVGFLGGLLAASSPLAQRVAALIGSDPRLEVLANTLDPVAGALELSRRLAEQA